MPQNGHPQTFPLRLPVSMRVQAIESAKHEGISLNQFIMLAIAEKLSKMEAIGKAIVEHHPSGSQEVWRP